MVITTKAAHSIAGMGPADVMEKTGVILRRFFNRKLLRRFGRASTLPSTDPLLIYFTSGTTGNPKMVLHTQASYGIGHQITARYWQDLGPGDVFWGVSDTGWAKAAWSKLFGQWALGATVMAWNAQGKPDFWIKQGDSPRPIHVALASLDRAGVDAFYEAGIAAGGESDGPPGLRPEYHPNYYGAFVLDPDGNSIEAVCHAPES